MIMIQGQMMQMLSYRTVLLADPGIGSGTHPMALRSIPHQSLALSISASMTLYPQWPYVHTPTRSHGLQATSALKLKGRAAAFKERDSNPDAYKKSRFALRWTIDARRMWQGLQTITEHKGKPSHELPSDKPIKWAKWRLWALRGMQYWSMHESTSCSGRPLNRSTFTRPQSLKDYQGVYSEHALTNWQVSSLTFSTCPWL